MEINEKLVKISGKFPIDIDEKFKLGQEVVFTGRGDIVKKEDWDTQNGTKDVVYIVKPTLIEIK